MKKSLDEHADRFSEHAAEYDERQDSAAYRDCTDLVVEYANPSADDVVLDVGTGTGAVALPLASEAAFVVGRDISEGMLAEARQKAAERGVENVEFGEGRFRAPNVDRDVDAESAKPPRAHARNTRVDVVTSNFAMHHLDDAQKAEAIDVIASLEPRRFVLGDVMLFGEADPEEPFYSPEVDDPATVGTLASAFTDAGFALTAVESVHDQVGVLVGERVDGSDVEEIPQ